MIQIQKHEINMALQKFLTNPGQVFIALATIFGISITFAMPIFMVPDEMAHFDRAYQVGGGHFVSSVIPGDTGGYVPSIPSTGASGYKHRSPLAWSQYFKRITSRDITFVSFPSSAVYSPIPYIPQAVGIDLARVFYPSLGTMVLLGRIFNLAVYILLVYLAIKIARQGKWVYVVAALFPVAMQEAASLSTDAMNIGLAFITIATMHYLLTNKITLNAKKIAAITFLSLGLGLTKQTNIIFLLPLLFVRKEVFKNFRNKLLIITGVFGACILAALAWFIVIKFQHYDLAKMNKAGVDQAAQVKYILTHPLSFVRVLFNSYIFEGFGGVATPDFYLLSMYGMFSWFLYKLPLLFILLGYLLLLLTLLHRDKNDTAITNQQSRVVVIQTITFLLSLVAIAGALYIVWSSVGASQVAGIQGRYLIPTLPLLIPLFVALTKWVRVTFDSAYRLGLIVASISSLNLLIMLALTLKYFY